MPIISNTMTNVQKTGAARRRNVAVVHAAIDRSIDEDRLALQTIAALRETGHSITLILPEKSPFAAMVKDQGIELASLPCEPPNRALPWDSIARIGGACGALWSKRIKLVHCTSPLPLATLLPAARMLKIPVVSQVHTIPEEEELDHSLCRFADLLFPSSPRVEQSLLSYLGRKKTHTIRQLMLALPGLDLPDMQAENRGIALRRSAGISADACLIAMTGALNPGTGFDLLFEAIQMIGRRGLRPPVWVGTRGVETLNQGEKGRNALIRLARNLGIDDQVHFVDIHRDAHAFFAAADILAVPARIDPLGMAAREGMLGGCAVVAAQTGGLTDAIVPHKTGLLVPPVDTPALAQAIFRLLVDFDLRSALSKGGRLHGTTNFTTDQYKNQILHGHDIAIGAVSATPLVQTAAHQSSAHPIPTRVESSKETNQVEI